MASPLERARDLLTKRLGKIEPTLNHDDPFSREWDAFLDTATALAELTRATSPEAAGRLLTTRELAAKFQVDPKTILRHRKAGLLTPVASPKVGRKGAALRWAP